MSEKEKIVTIDGPSGVGKSTISRKVAAALGFTYLDTGAMYRAVAWYLQQQNIAVDDEEKVELALADFSLRLLPAKDEEDDVQVVVAGRDISSEIRTPEMSMQASTVSKLAVVRSKLTQMQQRIGEQGNIVAEGRDTGTVVFPHALHKFFLDAKPEERARRRVRQLREKGDEQVDEKKILALTLERDRNDRERAIAPLCKAEDALLIDTTDLDIEEVTGQVLAAVKGKL